MAFLEVQLAITLRGKAANGAVVGEVLSTKMQGGAGGRSPTSRCKGSTITMFGIKIMNTVQDNKKTEFAQTFMGRQQQPPDFACLMAAVALVPSPCQAREWQGTNTAWLSRKQLQIGQPRLNHFAEMS